MEEEVFQVSFLLNCAADQHQKLPYHQAQALKEDRKNYRYVLHHIAVEDSPYGSEAPPCSIKLKLSTSKIPSTSSLCVLRS
ncbi:hypothetical protein Anas_03257, partial [Armadillidium nasatum]